QCHAVCEIEGDYVVGGIAGTVRAYSEIHASRFAGTISESAQAGGVCGRNYGTIRNCYAEATLNNSQFVGGLVGRNWGQIFHCFSAGHVSDSNFVGGLVENNSGGMIMSSYWDVNTSQIFTSSGGLPRTTEQLRDPNTFICWGCDPVWIIDAAVDYPRLWWEETPGELLENAKYLAGSGTAESPYILETADDLFKLSHAWCDWDKHFKLLNDVNLSDLDQTSWAPIGNDMWPFTGTFDGNNRTISGLTYHGLNQWLGLFGHINDPCAHILDLTLIDFDIESYGPECVGTLVGLLTGGQISRCHVIDTRINISVANGLGGLVGRSDGGRISRCSTSVFVSGEDYVGGLVGINVQGILEYCKAQSTVTSYGMHSIGGGLVARNDGGAIANCYSEGFVGVSEGSGGLVGTNMEGWIQNCYSASKVSGDHYTGGLIAGNVGGQVENSFWDIIISGQLTSAGGTGLPTEDMQLEQTFTGAGWDFNTPVWTIEEIADHPRLWWEPNVLSPKYAGGKGTIENPYFIALPEQLQQLGKNPQDWHKHFTLISDIDLSAYNGHEGSEPFNIIGNLFGDFWVPFSGLFDGAGHTISNFTCHGTNREIIGLFGYVCGPHAQIRNIHLTNPKVSGELIGYVGSLVGYLEGAAVSNCSVDGGFVSSVGDSYTISDIGGLIGYSQMATICNSSFAGDVKGDSDVGGLIGTIVQSTVSNSFSIGTVQDVGYGYYASGVGGLVGYNQNSTVLRCFADCYVVGSYRVGGLVGSNQGDISDSYALGDVNGVSGVGGIAGSCSDRYYPMSLSHSYAAGRVVAEGEGGGLVGTGYAVDCYTACFWDANVNNGLTGVGNNNPDPCGVIGETTENMKLAGTYINAGWDFVGPKKETANNTWRLCENGTDYPWLAWQFTEYADFLCPDGVDFIDYAILADQWYLERLEQDIVPEGGDGIVNFLDWAAFAADWQGDADFPTIAAFFDNWLKQRPTIADIAPPGGDDFVDWLDLAKFCENWLGEK
ncbi:MAG: GLUG motif-containing protein, partial [Planctomycetota bacterium]